MKNNASLVKSAKIINIAAAMILCAAGFVLMVNPFVNFLAEKIILGTAALLLGISKLFGYFSNDMYRLAFQFDLAIGIFVIILGIFSLATVREASEKYVLAVGLYIVLDGVLKLQTAVDAKKFGMKNWLYMLITSAGLVLVGIFVLASPRFESFSDNATVGAALFADGAQNAWITAYTVKVRSKKKHIFEDEE